MAHQPENISAGTQVVVLIEARGPNGSLVHPRGAVGVITRTPAVPGENFLVRFPDSFEKSLARPQIEVLKHFKDRLGDNSAGVSPASPRGGDSLSPKGMADSAFELEPLIIYRCVIGSRAYGLDHDASDMNNQKFSFPFTNRMRQTQIKAPKFTATKNFSLCKTSHLPRMILRIN